jgi:peptidoglycan/LPS O-acetylase OafA/YrhL
VFLKNLESLRGVAALMVALSHSLLVLTVDGIDSIWFATFSELQGVQSAITRFLLVFFNGGAAVIVFFVLSGYVLGLSLDKHALGIRQTFAFYVKRIFRLYPAHIVVLIGIVASMLLFYEFELFEAGSAWYALWYQTDINVTRVLQNMTLQHVDLNHIAWSLQVELAGSLFLPVFYVFARRLPLVLNTMVLAGLVWLSYYSSNLYLIFLYCFYAGLMLPQIHQQFSSAFSGKSANMLLVTGIATLCLGYTLAGPQSLFGRVLIETVGAMIIITCLLDQNQTGNWLNRFLARDVINRLGRYSYSFYLLHFVILYWLAYGLFHLVPADLLSRVPLLFGVGMMVVSVPITFWLAGKTYHHVEVPMVKLGKRVVQD